jgi:hypothetical protein
MAKSPLPHRAPASELALGPMDRCVKLLKSTLSVWLYFIFHLLFWQVCPGHRRGIPGFAHWSGKRLPRCQALCVVTMWMFRAQCPKQTCGVHLSAWGPPRALLVFTAGCFLALGLVRVQVQ